MISRTTAVVALALTVAGCSVQPLTPTPPAAAALHPVVVVQATHSLGSEPQDAAPIEATRPATASPVELPPTLVPSPEPAIALAAALPPTALPAPPVAAPAVVAAGDSVAAAEQYTIDLINAQRSLAGVAPLARDEVLMGIAWARVADMVARGYTGHHDPVTGESLARTMILGAGYTFAGENWYGSGRDPIALVERAMGWFMTDAPHTNNILSPRYTGVGIGIAHNGQQWLLVQNFGGL